MALSRRRFLAQVAAGGGGSLVYEAMTGLGLLAAPSPQASASADASPKSASSFSEPDWPA